LPLLKAGYLVLCDRYIYTAFARDAVRGCSSSWLHNLYGFACHPDITLFFNTPLQVALGRILGGRPQLKYHEAGMDLRLSADPYESFRIFQGKIFDEYLAMKERFRFIEIDGTDPIEAQQQKVRELIAAEIDLPRYRSRTIG
ncbi:MAG TPA: hypothetical protein VN642_05190, partial [Dongiaceae bacterium]|nr:hypothetical protein [Dongiaceae bacterium]